MKLADIATTRLINQQITGTKFTAIKDLVAWMGAMQAQAYAMAKWAVGVRLPGTTSSMVEAAISKGEIIRAHLLRPTWHLVSADDIYWMLDLTAPTIKSSIKSRHKELGLTKTVLTKNNAILTKSLSGGKHLTRNELEGEIKKAQIPTDGNRLSHLLMCAELDGIVCNGSVKGGKQTYALLEERVPKPKSITRDEALAKLAQGYFTSHGPATLQDFTWWSGLPASDAKSALEMVRMNLISETIDSQIYWFDPFVAASRGGEEMVYLLPAYDEFIISYKDREASLSSENHSRAISKNGIFWPTIVVNGQVTGIWKRTIKKNKVLLEAEFFTHPDRIAWSLIEDASKQLGRFLEKEVELKDEH